MKRPAPSRFLVAGLSLAATAVAAQTATTNGCGNDPQIARATVLGALHGMAFNPNAGSTWSAALGVPQDSVVPITAPAQCVPVVAAALNATSAPDTLPLRGVIRLGHEGFVVVRGSTPSGPGQHTSSSIALLGPRLEPKSYQRFQF